MMLRSFLPVGQGAFYRESFRLWNVKENEYEYHNIIYDCGSTNQMLVEQQIQNEFCKGDIIDAVFISHFDDDHTNGLPFLLSYCNVRCLFFPIISTTDSVLLKLKFLTLKQESSFAFQFVTNPNVAVSSISNSDTRLIGVVPQGHEDRHSNDFFVLSGHNCRDFIGNEFVKEYSEWNFIPFNFRQKDRIAALRDAIKDVFQNEPVPDDSELLNSFPKYKAKIIKAYKQIPGDFNTNSMTLFSGCTSNSISQRIIDLYMPRNYSCPEKYPCYFSASRRSGCLYMGDYDARGRWKWDDLNYAYRDYWKFIGCLQIPHHGSKYNYNTKLADINAIYVISAGMSNKYRHPHSQVIKDLLFKGKETRIISENRFSQVDLICDY